MKKLLISIPLIITMMLSTLNIIPIDAATNSSSIVIEQSTRRVLSGCNENVRLPMASTTKIMTALVVLEYANIDNIVEIPKEAVGVEGSSIYLKYGDKYSVKELLYGLMLRSGNDSAVALAIYVAGSVDNFVTLMNEKANSLGLTNTHFTNPHGLHDDNHYTSAYDLAIITATAMDNATFCEICSTKRYQREDGSYFYSKNKMLNMYEGGNGVKTGYTKRAGRCLVSSATRNNMKLICVVLNHGDMWNDSMYYLDNCFANYKMVNLAEKYGEKNVNVNKANVDYCKSKIIEDAYYPLKDNEIEKIEYKENIVNSIDAPVYIGQDLGFVEIFLDNHLLFSKKLCSIENIERKNILDWLKEIV